MGIHERVDNRDYTRKTPFYLQLLRGAPHVPRRQNQAGRLSVFKGREAKLNKAIFHTLAHKGPQTIYDIHKHLKAQRGLRYTKYASVNKRTRDLEESGYLKKTGQRKTRAGFEASTYELTARAYLAILLDSIDLENLLMSMDEATASAIIAIIIHVT